MKENNREDFRSRKTKNGGRSFFSSTFSSRPQKKRAPPLPLPLPVLSLSLSLSLSPFHRRCPRPSASPPRRARSRGSRTLPLLLPPLLKAATGRPRQGCRSSGECSSLFFLSFVLLLLRARRERERERTRNHRCHRRLSRSLSLFLPLVLSPLLGRHRAHEKGPKKAKNN